MKSHRVESKCKVISRNIMERTNTSWGQHCADKGILTLWRSAWGLEELIPLNFLKKLFILYWSIDS